MPCPIHVFRSAESRRKAISSTVFILLVFGCAVLLVAAFSWDSTIKVDGSEYSGVLLLCSFVAGGIGTMSNVTYWAFATRYPTHCTVTSQLFNIFSPFLLHALCKMFY